MNKPKKPLYEELKALLIRMWVAGMVCFMVAFTPLGGAEGADDIFIVRLIFLLALFLFLANRFIVNMVIKGAFATRLDILKPHKDKPIWLKVLSNMTHFIIMVVITICIWLTYVLINVIIENMGYKSEVHMLMLEPFSFSLFYGMYFSLFYFPITAIAKKRKRI
ncbi:MAG: hypothetical protein WC939_05565 [Acholeplasmataceae bacterium]